MPINRERSHELFTRAQQLFPGGVNSPVRAFRSVGGEPFMVAKGEGPFLFDADGNRYVDYICSWGPLVIGHAHPKVVAAISEQAQKGTSFGASHELEIKLAEKIMSLVPSLEMMRFVNSGTEASMSAIRLARGFTGRNIIVKFEGCYHGHTDSLLAKAGSGVLTLGLPECAGIPEGITANTILAQFNDPQGMREIFKKYGKDIAAVILEPVVGNCGLLVPEQEFLTDLRKVTEEHGALLIFDEVMTGFRVHLNGAQKLYNIKPDLTMLGKVIGGGLPVGAYGGRKDIMEKIAPLGPVYQAGTLSGNPLAMSAGLATLEEWTKPGVFEKTATAASTLVQSLKESARSAGLPIYADSVGTMFGFFFSEKPVKNYQDTQNADKLRFNKFFHAILNRGVYFAPSAFEAGFISAAHIGEALDHTVKQIPQAMAEIK